MPSDATRLLVDKHVAEPLRVPDDVIAAVRDAFELSRNVMAVNAHQTLGVIRDRSQTTLVSQSNLIGKPGDLSATSS
ncbi:hypothetical protein [Burkholderia sp. BCC1998]|uniref:hypothetical protein n=1 Tax=Burkholderia sp. BCC1998 TaxID=2817447 RepID=UPI002AB64E5E|nr:hypothetical protein [Burkholderia sp. BCC1998]